jgi:quercetin dioxygenase-like cupin family protein
MRIARAARAGAPSQQRGDTFVGTVLADPVLEGQDGVTVNNVFFTPGGRTNWHRHEVGQVLYVLAGAGWLQSRDGAGGPLQVGDVAHIPAGEEHWHGAAAESYLLHLAVSVGTTEWLEAVSDADYGSAQES